MQNPAIERKKSEASLIGNRLPDRTKEPRRSIYNYDSSLLESQTRIYFFWGRYIVVHRQSQKKVAPKKMRA